VKALETVNVCLNFGGVTALKDVSLTVEKGERVAIIGPNGAGKTTLFNVLTGKVKPTSGDVLFFKKDITRMSIHKRAHIGIARSFQIVNLFPELTVLDNTLLAVQGIKANRFQIFRPITAYQGIYQRAEELLNSFRLWNLHNEPVHSIAYGDQRKLEIALSLSSKPKMLLLDEPNCGLTKAEGEEIIQMIRDLDRDITVIIVAHDMELVTGVADKIIVLHYGQVIIEGNPTDVCNDPKVNEIYMGTDEGFEIC
jgi:branched-chain amino acid transport system ATP-binding protein